MVLHLVSEWPPLWGALSTLICASCYIASGYYTPRWVKAYRSLEYKKQRDWDTRVASFLHAVVVTGLTAYILLVSDMYSDMKDPEDPRGPPVLRTYPLTLAVMYISMGYFLVDLAILQWHFPKLGGWAMCAHHIISMITIWVAINTPGGHIYIMMQILTEVTTPFLHIRWWLYESGLDDSIPYFINGMLLLATWTVGRIYVVYPLFRHMWLHWDETLQLPTHAAVITVLAPTSMAILNTYWYGLLLDKAVRVLLPGAVNKKKAVTTRKEHDY